MNATEMRSRGRIAPAITQASTTCSRQSLPLAQKTLLTLLRFACAARCDAGKELRRLNPVIFLFSEQDSLGGHGDSAEMTAAVPKCFTNHCNSCGFKSFAKVSEQLSPPDAWSIPVDVVLLIDLPPRIKHIARRRLFQQPYKRLN